MLDSRNFSAATGTWSILRAFPGTKVRWQNPPSHYTPCLFFFFCKMAPSTYFESDWTLHNTCFKVNDSVSPILRRSSQTHVSVGSVVMVGKVELDSSVADRCSRRGQMFPRVCDVAQTHWWSCRRRRRPIDHVETSSSRGSAKTKSSK